MGAQKAILMEVRGERDWLVREDSGREFGHYPTRAEAESVGQKLALKRSVELVVHGERG